MELKYSEWTTDGWMVYEVRDNTSYPMIDYCKTESEAWKAYEDAKRLYFNQVLH